MKIILSIITLLICININAQQELHPCGTPSIKSEWLKKYQKNPSVYDKRSGEILWVPMSVSLVGQDDGASGYMSADGVMEALCVLNEDFAEAEIQFYLAKPLRYIQSTKYAEHTSVLEGAEMMFEYNYPDMINNYIMANAAGNCGYNLPYAGVALSINCAKPTDHTWAHEIGHNLSLPHPFLGWEGGVSHDGTVNHNYNDPAPEMITYDYTFFQDTLILDTLIIDTAYVEKMDGSNCDFAADGFCDTKPDYLAQRWPCSTMSSNSTTEQTDPNGVKFFSDGTLFMSYALDACASRFSGEQIAAARANLIDEKPTYLGNEMVEEPTGTDEVAILTPEQDAIVYFQDIYMEWEEVEHATSYVVQLARFPNYAVVVLDTLVNNPYIDINELRFGDKKHYIRIKAVNDYNFCGDYIAFGAFEATDELLSVEEDNLSTISIEPSLLQKGDYLLVQNQESHKFKLSVTDFTGRTVMSKDIQGKTTTLSTRDWDAGIYLVSIQQGSAIITKKIAVTN